MSDLLKPLMNEDSGTGTGNDNAPVKTGLGRENPPPTPPVPDAKKEDGGRSDK